MNNSLNNTNNSKVKLNDSKGNKNIIIITIILLLSLTFLILFIVFTNNNQENNNNNNKEENNKPLTELEKKLIELENINEKLDFFKEEYIDRYIEYKNNNPNLDLEKVIIYVNIGLDQEFYSKNYPSPNQNTNKVLTNKFYSLSKDYVPNNLETIDSNFSSGNKQMVKEAKEAFEQMAKDAKTEGYNIRAVSTYRSYQYQENLYSNYVKADGTEKADTYSARAGSSEHQTGLAVDVDNITLSYTSFGKTKEYEWMQQNAYKYGFILRYTKEAEFITGYKEEPWHYRYVGIEIATYIQNNPMTYEEYFVRFLDK